MTNLLNLRLQNQPIVAANQPSLPLDISIFLYYINL